jgi:superfamily II DNA or RNA helicase
MKPRRYQERAIENFQTWANKSGDDWLGTFVLPTGTGKTQTAKWSLEKLQEQRPFKFSHRVRYYPRY